MENPDPDASTSSSDAATDLDAQVSGQDHALLGGASERDEPPSGDQPVTTQDDLYEPL